MTNKLVLLLAVICVVLAGSCNQVIAVRPSPQFTTGSLTEGDIQSLTNTEDSSGEPYRVGESGTHTLLSLGPATTGKTYYVDAERGDDLNSGRHPLKAWKTLKNVNSREFRAGDHILLEANSVWNGESVTPENYTTLPKSDKVGMIWFQSSGTEAAPIVIDLYNMELAAEGSDDPRPVVYYSANQRPIINGNGTPSTVYASNPYKESAPIQLEGTDWVTIRNIEVTNTFVDWTKNENRNHWQDYRVRKALLGITAIPANGKPYLTGITIQNCYVHDIQSEHNNNGGALYTSTDFGGSHSPTKGGGGVIVNGAYKVLVEGNIVKKVGLEGLRSHGTRNKNGTVDQMVIRGNYVESVAGDGIVTSQTVSKGSAAGGYSAIIESNIIKDACAAVLGGANYAACWTYYGNNNLFQYNEAYGTIYGNNDGEAWDIDNQANNTVYQYNYSHHNAGGTILFMSDISHGVFRYNISVNDGGGTRYLATVPDPNSEFTISTTANSYAAWRNGQCIFHYTATNTSANTKIPLIYNNTFYVGDKLTCGLFGHNATSAVKKYVRFINNVVVKAGAGTLYLSYGQSGSGIAGSISNDAGFTNNLLWGYGTNPETGDYSKFDNGSGTAPADLFAKNNNKWENPKLKIQETGGEDTLRLQRNDAFPEASFNDPTELADFTGKSRLRSRAALFAPTGTNLAERGTTLASGTSSFDGAWNAPALAEDFFGNAFTKPPLGAAAAGP